MAHLLSFAHLFAGGSEFHLCQEARRCYASTTYDLIYYHIGHLYLLSYPKDMVVVEVYNHQDNA